jgi:hypothetical protein
MQSPSVAAAVRRKQKALICAVGGPNICTNCTRLFIAKRFAILKAMINHDIYEGV